MNLIDETISEVKSLNQRLIDGFLFFDSHDGINKSTPFFDNVRKFGISPDEIMVLSLTPDSGDTVIGRFMTKEGRIYYFDFDLENYDYSNLTPVPAQGKPDEIDSFRNSEYLEEVAGEFLLKNGI